MQNHAKNPVSARRCPQHDYIFHLILQQAWGPSGAPPKQQPDYRRLDTLLTINKQSNFSNSHLENLLHRLGYDSTAFFGTMDKPSQEGSVSAYCAQSPSTNTPISGQPSPK
ncbi:hypothetical protein GW17_00000346, partial [Ensete ventricosum]